MDIAAYGHSHILSDEVRPFPGNMDCGSTVKDTAAHGENNIRYLNPGSCGPKRFRLPVTMMVLTFYPAEHQIEVEKIDCLSAAWEKKEAVKMPEQDMHKLVQEIMREADAGKNISQIAARNHIEEGFVEQVCRMYLTHPGVDVDGIMDRIERRNL